MESDSTGQGQAPKTLEDWLRMANARRTELVARLNHVQGQIDLLESMIKGRDDGKKAVQGNQPNPGD